MGRRSCEDRVQEQRLLSVQLEYILYPYMYFYVSNILLCICKFSSVSASNGVQNTCRHNGFIIGCVPQLLGQEWRINCAITGKLEYAIHMLLQTAMLLFTFINKVPDIQNAPLIPDHRRSFTSGASQAIFGGKGLACDWTLKIVRGSTRVSLGLLSLPASSSPYEAF